MFRRDEELELEASGAAWCARFPGSAAVEDLALPFRQGVVAFIAALRAGGAGVTIASTYRPPERAYLMHWACMIAQGAQDPQEVPAMDGVPIDWSHAGDDKAARAAAAAMTAGYSIKFPAALASRHTQRLAIDMAIGFRGQIAVRPAAGAPVLVSSQSDLWPIGAGFGVIKLLSDPPHWSSDGH